MLDQIYETLSRIGYPHPLHPPVTHIPVGLVIGAFFFSLAARIFNNQNLARSAKHCIILALLAVPLAVLFGLMDWQHFYAGAWLPPIGIKMVLAGVMALLLLVTWGLSGKKHNIMGRFIVGVCLCLVTVMALGYFGGELVYGQRSGTMAAIGTPPLVQQGEALFSQRCAGCHFADSSEDKIGPGFKGLFQLDRMPSSQKPVSEAAIVSQLKAPVGSMPPFPDLSQEQIQELIAYMKTL